MTYVFFIDKEFKFNLLGTAGSSGIKLNFISAIKSVNDLNHELLRFFSGAAKPPIKIQSDDIILKVLDVTQLRKIYLYYCIQTSKKTTKFLIYLTSNNYLSTQSIKLGKYLPTYNEVINKFVELINPNIKNNNYQYFESLNNFKKETDDFLLSKNDNMDNQIFFDFQACLEKLISYYKKNRLPDNNINQLPHDTINYYSSYIARNFGI